MKAVLIALLLAASAGAFAQSAEDRLFRAMTTISGWLPRASSRRGAVELDATRCRTTRTPLHRAMRRASGRYRRCW